MSILKSKGQGKPRYVELIKERRKNLGRSQAELVQLGNLSVNGISKLESQPGDREVKLSTLFKLSGVLPASKTNKFVSRPNGISFGS